MKTKIFLALLLAGILGAFLMPSPSEAEYGDIVMEGKAEAVKAGGVNQVVFPHWFHRIRFKCKVCHEEIFIMKKGSNDINMGLIMEGKFCGKCHDGNIAWAAFDCAKCHSYEGAAK
ncbi:MAG: hypothetical protein OEV59_01975 [Deltaproteobacteria bacterium]|nr:hypothetical protein [Deltaproteobacteria bacterium]